MACTNGDPPRGGLSAHWAGRYTLQLVLTVGGGGGGGGAVHQDRGYGVCVVCGVCVPRVLCVSNYCGGSLSVHLLHFALQIP